MRRRWLFVLGMLGGPASVAAQTGSIRGTVYDSLMRAPLAGASVFVEGGGAITTTDAGGRFVLDSVPVGKRVISFSHDALDSIGVSGASRSVDVVAGAGVELALATPSYETLRRAACGATAGAAADSGFVFGAIRDADSDQLLAGAKTQLVWRASVKPVAGAVDLSLPHVVATTDSTGTYYACGVPLNAVLAAQAFAATQSSGSVPVTVGPRRIARLDLLISMHPVDAAARTAVLEGVVRGPSGAPVASAQAIVSGTEATATSDANGVFRISGLSTGTQALTVMRVGFAGTQLPVALKAKDTVRVEVRLQPAQVLAASVTTGKRAFTFDSVAYAQRLTLGGYGMIGEQLQKRVTLEAALREFPQMSTNRRQGHLLLQVQRGNGTCNATLYVDGIRTAPDVLDTVRPEDLVAIEAYPDEMVAPMEFRTRSRCGIVLVWTKSSTP